MKFLPLSRRGLIAAAGSGAAGVALSGAIAFPALAQHRQHPNIVLITADDLGYGDLSCYGRADFQTPFLDGLAASGVRFTQAYSIAPICTPTRVGLMTGRYPERYPVGLLEPLTLTREHGTMGLDPALPTLPALLKGAGYATGLFGKWHLGALPRFHPNRHGFDEFFGPLGGAVDYVDHRDPMGAHDLYRNGDEVHVSGYLTELIADEAVRFIHDSREPFFLSHQGTAPHSPWQKPGDSPVERVGEGVARGLDVGPADRFPAMMLALDKAVGRILAALNERQVARNTLVIFTSDNGGKQYSNMAGLARGKGHVWEGGIRVPAIFRWPDALPSGLTSRQVASTLDWTATMLAAAGAASPASSPPDGIDVVPLLAGPPRDRTIFWRMGREKQGAVRSGGWKYLREGDREHLFNLVLDPGERRDLKALHPDRFAELRAAYERWDKEMLPLPA